mmetsp:Transcript_11757/g.49357  ORF Transcript_11757/g.49357 Transcript_11757/m.49357 type:complete len:206 (-) Transcript_11757:4088-4705(-)
MFWTMSHISTISDTVDSLVIQSLTLDLKGAEYLLVAMEPSCICASSSFSMSSPVVDICRITSPLCLYFVNSKICSDQSSSTCSSFCSIWASFTAPPARSSTSSAILNIFRSMSVPNLNTSSPRSNVVSKSSWSCVQCLGRMSLLHRRRTRGRVPSRNSSIFFLQSLNAGQSFSDFGRYLLLYWNIFIFSSIPSIWSLTSDHNTSA